MAIKWKKSHPALSFLCFWMAIHLFVTAIFLAVYSCNLVGYTVGAGNPLSTGPAGVWQLTNRFHSDLSEIMQSVLWEQLDEEYKEELEFSASESGGNLKIAVKRGDTQVINTFSGPVPASPKEHFMMGKSNRLMAIGAAGICQAPETHIWNQLRSTLIR